jgi:hypothetical protein
VEKGRRDGEREWRKGGEMVRGGGRGKRSGGRGREGEKGESVNTKERG